MPIDKWGHSRPDPLFPKAFYNGQEWDMAATGLHYTVFEPPKGHMNIDGEIYSEEVLQEINKALQKRGVEIMKRESDAE